MKENVKVASSSRDNRSSDKFHSELYDDVTTYDKTAGSPSTVADSVDDAVDATIYVAPSRSTWVIHLWLCVIQTMFGAGVIVAKIGLEKFHPLLFALVRESCAAPIIFVVARHISPGYPISFLRSLRVFALPGLLLFGNQLNFIIGLNLSDEISAAAWQPSQPIITAVFAVCLGLEVMTFRKLIGILLGVTGAVILVLGGYGGSKGETWAQVIGNICFLLNCTSHAVYVIASRVIIQKEKIHPVYCVAFAYIITAFCMFWTFLFLGSWPTTQAMLCPHCDPTLPLFHIPLTAVPALIYWILFTSVLSYIVITWATSYVDPSAVSIWTVFQPLTTVAFTLVITLLDLDVASTLSVPGLNSLGAIPIIIGLALVVKESARQAAKRRDWVPAEDLDSFSDVNGTICTPTSISVPTTCDSLKST